LESADHRWLKQVGAAFLLENGCSAVATEVRCPIHRFRVDVAGYLDPLPKRERPWQTDLRSPLARTPLANRLLPRRRERAFTCLIECKQSRADFLRDRRDAEALVQRRAALDRERAEMEQTRIREQEPHLRRSGTSLFPELEVWDYHRSEDRAYLALLGELDRVDRKLHGQTKFTRAARYRLGDALVLLTPPALIEPEEVPPGWGLLEADRDTGAVRVATPVPEHDSGERRRQRVLRNIAIAASRRALALSDAMAPAPALPESADLGDNPGSRWSGGV
jgi:hypothetical protein